MSRYCENCHGSDLRFIKVGPGQYWRKECMDCGSTGPFASTIDTSPSGLAKMNMRGLEISVARFCDEDSPASVIQEAADAEFSEGDSEDTT